jgi:RNA polymerase sigma factor (sigma-70 family)
MDASALGGSGDATVDLPVVRAHSSPTSGDSFEVVYDRNWQALYRFAFVLLGDRNEAEETAQEAFARWYVRRDSVTNPDAYLRTVVANLSRGRHRRRAVARRHEQKAHHSIFETAAPEDPINLIVRGLPNKQQVAIVLRYVEGRSDDEIAVILQCRPTSVRSLLARAIKQLRAEMQHGEAP